jgi:Tfp pilus assembly PilM family ATPase
LYEGKFLGFEEFTFILGENKNESGSVSLLTEEVYKKIDQVLSIYFDGNDQSDLDRILIFGRSIPPGLIDELQELCPAPVDTVNPFNKIRLSAQAEQSRGTHDFHDFLIAVGTALRGVRS